MWLWRAFNRLATTRPRGFGIGPISYRECMLYADELELGSDTRDFMWEVIRRLDVAFLKAQSEKSRQEAEIAKAQRERPRG